MRKMLLATMCALAVVGFTDCKSRSKTASAGEAAKSYHETLTRGNYDVFVDDYIFHDTPLTSEQRKRDAELLRMNAKPRMDRMGGVKDVKVVSERVNSNGRTAEVKLRNTYNNGAIEDVTYNLVRDDNRWKINMGNDREVWKVVAADGTTETFKLKERAGDNSQREVYKDITDDDRTVIKEKSTDNKEVVKVKEDGHKAVVKVKDTPRGDVVKVKNDGRKDVVRVDNSGNREVVTSSRNNETDRQTAARTAQTARNIAAATGTATAATAAATVANSGSTSTSTSTPSQSSTTNRDMAQSTRNNMPATVNNDVNMPTGNIYSDASAIAADADRDWNRITDREQEFIHEYQTGDGMHNVKIRDHANKMVVRAVEADNRQVIKEKHTDYKDAVKYLHQDKKCFVKELGNENKEVLKVKEGGIKEVVKIKHKNDHDVIKTKYDGHKEVTKTQNLTSLY